MKIVIAGYGFVGKAVDSLFKNKTQFNVLISDPYKKLGASFFNADAVIICVATPEEEDGSCDVSNIIDVLIETPLRSQVLIKSTMSIEGWEKIRQQFPEHKIVFSPEFLRAATAVDDFKNQKHMILGGEHDNVSFWINTFRSCGLDIYYEMMSVKEAILIKYFRNSFLATKVAFFNQVYDLCEKLKIPFHVVQRGIAYDERIGRSHTEVTEERGFGGHCFPKDTKAIIKTGKHFDVHLSLIEEAVDYNNKIRKF